MNNMANTGKNDGNSAIKAVAFLAMPVARKCKTFLLAKKAKSRRSIIRAGSLVRTYLYRARLLSRRWFFSLQRLMVRLVNNHPQEKRGCLGMMLRLLRGALRKLPFIRRINNKASVQNYLLRSSIFSENVKASIGNQTFDVIINSDNITLEAGYALSQIMPHAKRVYDAIELPHLNTRSGDVFEGFTDEDLRCIHTQEARYINSCDALTVIGPSFKEWFLNNYDVDNIEIVRNCRNYEIFPQKSSLKQDIGINDTDILILFINGVYQDQGIEQVLHALQHLPSYIHFATLGPHSKENYITSIQRLAKKLRVQNRFHILPSKPWDQMLNYASGADIGIIPRQPSRLNNYLSLPNRIFELVMARLPVASTSLPDISAIVRQYNIGGVFDETKPVEIAACITQMISNNNLATYKHNVSLAARELCWEKEKQRLLTFVEKLFPEKKTLNIIFLSRKDISKNNRIARLTRTLTEAGHKTTVVAPFPPGELHKNKDAVYLIAPDKKTPAQAPEKHPVQSRSQKWLISRLGHKLLIWLRHVIGPKTPHVVFIVGSPRSGTHLLNSVLCFSSRVTPLLTESWPIVHLLKTYGLIRSHTNRYPDHYFRDAEDCRKFFSQTLSRFIRHTYYRYNKPYAVFRVPYLAKSVYLLEPLLKYSGIKYDVLVMVRDPRDIIASLVTINRNLSDSGEESLTNEIVSLCERYIRSYYSNFINRRLSNISFIRYEELATHPKETAGGIGELLGLDLSGYDPGNDWRNVKNNWVREDDPRQTCWVTDLYKKPVSTSSIGSYKKTLSAAQVAEIENAIPDIMKFFNYPMDGLDKKEVA